MGRQDSIKLAFEKRPNVVKVSPPRELLANQMQSCKWE